MNSLMKGKRGIVMGVANDRSLAWGIAKQLADCGAEIAFSYQSETLYKRVAPLAESIGMDTLVECNVIDDKSIDNLFKVVGEKFGKIDFVVHAIAFSDKNELTGKYMNTSRENFLNSMNISCYSFTSVCRHAQPYMSDNGSILCLTYLGSQRVMPNYNVMGVVKAALESSVKYLAVDLGEFNTRVNAISAGPVKTLAASGIGDFKYILKWNELNSPLKRNTTLEDVGGVAAFLLSDLGRGVTGNVIYADSGYHVVGMKAIDAPDISVVS